MVSLKPVERRSLSDAIFEQLRGQILDGRMGPGTPLPSERKLCEMLGVNRGAVREALKRLEQASLVSIQQGGATRVADYRERGGLELLGALVLPGPGAVDTGVVRSIMEMRSAIAPDAARLAALRAGDEVKQALHEVVARMEAAEAPAESQRLTMAFWSEIVRGSGNIAYRLAHNTLRGLYVQVFDLLTGVLSDEYVDVESYRVIADAVAAGDTAEAERRARELLNKGAARMGTLLDALEGDER